MQRRGEFAMATHCHTCHHILNEISNKIVKTEEEIIQGLRVKLRRQKAGELQLQFIFPLQSKFELAL